MRHEDTVDPEPGEWEAEPLEVPVYGMTCSGCAAGLQLGLSQLDGVREVEVDLAGSRAVVTGSAEVTEEQLCGAVERLGYQVTPPAAASAAVRRPAWWRWALIVVGLAAGLAGGSLVFQAAAERYFHAEALASLNEAFARPSILTIGLALAFGLVVGFAPSTLAMAPAVMGYVRSTHATSVGRATRISAAFVAGMVVIDMAVGAAIALAGAAALRFLGERLVLWNAVVAVVLFVLALITLRLWRPNLPSMLPRAGKANSAAGAFAMGLPFGLLTCPACTPLLLPVALGAAATANPAYGAALLGAFALGRGVLLTVLGASTGTLHTLAGATRAVPWIERALGVLLLAGAGYFLREFLTMGGVAALL